MIHKLDPRHLVLLLFLAFLLIAILAASVWHRVSNPSLTVTRFTSQEQQSQTPANSNMAAIGQLMEIVSKNPHDIQALLLLTESLMAAGQWQGAENFAQKALAEPGENGKAMYLLAVIHHNQGKNKEAAELLEKLLEKEDNPPARYSLGILYIHFLNLPELGREQLLKGLGSDAASPSLVQAIQEELGKLPPVPEKQPATDSGQGEAQLEHGQTREAQDSTLQRSAHPGEQKHQGDR